MIKDLGSKMNKILITVGVVLGIVVVFLMIKNQSADTPPSHTHEEIHIHAGFQVYVDDQLQDYSGFEHMKISPCYEGERVELTPEEEQLEIAHLHDNVGDVVHVHREGATWIDLFSNANIPMGVNPTAYVNGEKVDNILSREIENYDSVVFFEGENTNIEEKLSNAVTNERIVEVEGMSESCSS